jgi:alpha-glucosidase (family GH31 glycosyl hydrolase)
MRQFLDGVGTSLSMDRSLTVPEFRCQKITRTVITTRSPRGLQHQVLGRRMLFTTVNDSESRPCILTSISHFFYCPTALGDLSLQTVATNATHDGGRTELEMHNLFGHLMSRAANIAVREMYPGKRPFLISRSTFAGSGTWTGHWVGYIFLMTVQTQV